MTQNGYGFDVPIANPEQANAVIKFFQDRGYSTFHGYQLILRGKIIMIIMFIFEAPNADVLKNHQRW